jgi:AICAR transformylase/IMP cyclohydrolase PurH
MLVSYQVLIKPIVSESIESIDMATHNILPSTDYNYDHVEQILSNDDNYDQFRQHMLNKLSKRRAQAKANLAGLWGVPTRFA